MDAIVTSFAFTAVSIAASNLIQTRCCFKEGTLVETEEGLKPIEEIEVGDKVLAYDEETGEQAYKPVVQLFRNETKEWYHVQVNGEEIVCTGGHPFYVLNAAAERQKVNYEGQAEGARGAWICANKLRIGDEVLLSDGSVSAIGDVQPETLTAPETTYNFEVADFHTYYVSDSKVLVHNRCKLGKNMEKAGKSLKDTEDAHHLYPQKYRSKFKKIGIDVDDAANGIAMDSKIHRAGAYAYNKLWADVIDEVTKETAETYMKQFMKKVYNVVLKEIK